MYDNSINQTKRNFFFDNFGLKVLYSLSLFLAINSKISILAKFKV